MVVELKDSFAKASILPEGLDIEAGLHQKSPFDQLSGGPEHKFMVKDPFHEDNTAEAKTENNEDQTLFKGRSAMDLITRNKMAQPDPNAQKPADRQTQQALNEAKKVVGQNNYFTQVKVGLAETGTEAKSISKQGQDAKQVVNTMKKGQIALAQMEGAGSNAAKPAAPAVTSNTAGMDVAATGAGSLATNGRGSSSELDMPMRKESENGKTVTADVSYSSTPAIDTRQTQSQAFLNNMSKGTGFGNADDLAERSVITSMSLTDEDTKMTVKLDDAKALQAQMKTIELHAKEAGLGVDKWQSQGLVVSAENFERTKSNNAVFAPT